MPVPASITDNEFKKFHEAVFSALQEGGDSIDLLAFDGGDCERLLPRLLYLYEEFADRVGKYFAGVPKGAEWGRRFHSVIGTTQEHSDGSITLDVLCEYKYSYTLSARKSSVKSNGSLKPDGTRPRGRSLKAKGQTVPRKSTKKIDSPSEKLLS